MPGKEFGNWFRNVLANLAGHRSADRKVNWGSFLNSDAICVFLSNISALFPWNVTALLSRFVGALILLNLVLFWFVPALLSGFIPTPFLRHIIALYRGGLLQGEFHGRLEYSQDNINKCSPPSIVSKIQLSIPWQSWSDTPEHFQLNKHVQRARKTKRPLNLVTLSVILNHSQLVYM